MALRFSTQPALMPSCRERGVSLIMVMMILIIVSVLGIGGVQVATMAERSARNDRDYQIAFQSAEAALRDAEFDIYGPNSAAGARNDYFTINVNVPAFIDGCGSSSSGKSKGLCLSETLSSGGVKVPTWTKVDFTDTTSNAKTVAYGDFTNRSFSSGLLGPQPVQAPRYIIEIMDDHDGVASDGTTPQKRYVFRVTAMGFGPRADIQAVVQMVYRVDSN